MTKIHQPWVFLAFLWGRVDIWHCYILYFTLLLISKAHCLPLHSYWWVVGILILMFICLVIQSSTKSWLVYACMCHVMICLQFAYWYSILKGKAAMILNMEVFFSLCFLCVFLIFCAILASLCLCKFYKVTNPTENTVFKLLKCLIGSPGFSSLPWQPPHQTIFLYTAGIVAKLACLK